VGDNSSFENDVFSQVTISFKVMDAWLEAISEIALSFRFKQLSLAVDIGMDTAFINSSGGLTMITMVGGEPVRMIVPNNLWDWK